MGKARDVVEAAFRAYNEHDLDAMLKDYDGDATFWSTARPAGLRGIAQVREVSQGLFTAFPDSQLELTHIIESGDWVVVEFTSRGTHKGTLVTAGGTIPPTGKTVDGEGVDIVEVRNGKIVSERIYADNLDFMRQLGLMPAASTAS